MHTENDSIAQCIRAPKEAHKQAARVGMPIKYATLVTIAIKLMLATQRFPTTNKKWEDLGRSAHMWGKWKEMYKNQRKKPRVKRQAAGGQKQFGRAVLKVRAGGAANPSRRGTPVTIDELEDCFDSPIKRQLQGKQR